MNSTIISDWSRCLFIHNNVVSEKLKNMILKTHLIPNSGDLTISKDSDCEKLFNRGTSSIIIEAGYCNELTGDRRISYYPYLESITIKASTTSEINTLANLNSLTISNNPLLKSIIIEDGYDISYGSCVNVKELYLTSLIGLVQFI